MIVGKQLRRFINTLLLRKVRKRNRRRSHFSINWSIRSLLLRGRRSHQSVKAATTGTATTTINSNNTTGTPASVTSRMATYTYYECLLIEPDQAIIFVDQGEDHGSTLHVYMEGSNLHYSAPRRPYSAIEEYVRDKKMVGTVPAEGGDERVREVANELALPMRGGVEQWLEEVRNQLKEENVLST